VVEAVLEKARTGLMNEVHLTVLKMVDRVSMEVV
jgi:hypothetical protein